MLLIGEETILNLLACPAKTNGEVYVIQSETRHLVDRFLAEGSSSLGHAGAV